MKIVKRKDGAPTLEELMRAKADIEADIESFEKIIRRRKNKEAIIISQGYAGSKKSYYKSRIDELRFRLCDIDNQIKEIKNNE